MVDPIALSDLTESQQDRLNKSILPQLEMQMDTTIPIINDRLYSISLAEEELGFPQRREANVTDRSVLGLLNPKANCNLIFALPETEVKTLKIPCTIWVMS